MYVVHCTTLLESRLTQTQLKPMKLPNNNNMIQQAVFWDPGGALCNETLRA